MKRDARESKCAMNHVPPPTEVMNGRIAKKLPKMLENNKNGENKDGNRNFRCA
jgi:hypothetical protein